MESFRLLWQRPPSDCPLSQLVHASRHVAGGASGKRWGLPISSDSCTVLRITLVLEARVALMLSFSQNPFRRMHVRYVA